MAINALPDIADVAGLKVSYRRMGSGKRKILFFHGFPGSSAQAELFSPHLASLDLDVLCVDRPGYNQTQSKDSEQLMLNTRIHRELLMQLGWSQCEFVAVSGGTPFLFSLVGKHPELATHVTVVSGLAPIFSAPFANILGWKTLAGLRALPYIPGSLISGALTHATSGKKNERLKLLRHFLPTSKPDELIMQDEGVQLALNLGLKEAFLQNGHGPKRDAVAYQSNWKVNLGSFQGPVQIWHGSEDLILPPKIGEAMAGLLPQSKLHMIEGEGHYSLIIRRIADILQKHK